MKKIKGIVSGMIIIFIIIFINSISFAWGNGDIDNLEINEKIIL